MREDLWEFDPTHTVIVAANHKPEVRGTDEGIWRRIKIVPWEVMIPKAERDPHLPRKLEAELESILAWAVRGAVEWGREGLGEPTAVTSQTDEYQRDQDVLASFIYDECVEAPDLYVKSETLYIRYKNWCELNGEYKHSQKAFSQRLKERGYPKVRRKYGMVWEGIALREDGGGGPGAGLDPTPGAGLGVGTVHPESGLDKPETRAKNEGCRVVYPKSGSTPPENPRVEVLTGKTIHHPTPYTLLDSDTSVEEAARQRRASR
jgi:phage/plasmid-associated DNA primase